MGEGKGDAEDGKENKNGVKRKVWEEESKQVGRFEAFLFSPQEHFDSS